MGLRDRGVGWDFVNGSARGIGGVVSNTLVEVDEVGMVVVTYVVVVRGWVMDYLSERRYFALQRQIHSAFYNLSRLNHDSHPE